MPDLSDDLLHAAQGLFYREWSIAHDALKAEKAATPEGLDWQQFHQHRLKASEKELAKWKALLDEINPHAPLTRKP